MGVYIRGMDMPKSCDQCPCRQIFGDKFFCGVTGDDIYKIHVCPLVEVPTPHGRLVDADAFRRRCFEAIPYGFANEDEIRAYNKILGLLKEAPTIIEAEE